MLLQYFNCNERLKIFLTCFCNILCYVGRLSLKLNNMGFLKTPYSKILLTLRIEIGLQQFASVLNNFFDTFIFILYILYSFLSLLVVSIL